MPNNQQSINSTRPGFFFEDDLNLKMQFFDKICEGSDTFDFKEQFVSTYRQLLEDIRVVESSADLQLSSNWERDLSKDFKSLLSNLEIVFSDIKRKDSRMLDNGRFSYSRTRNMVSGETGSSRVLNDLVTKTRYTGITFENILYDILLLRALVLKEFTLSLAEGDFGADDLNFARICQFVFRSFQRVERDSFYLFVSQNIWSCVSKFADIRYIKKRGASNCYWCFLFMLNSSNLDKSGSSPKIDSSLNYLNFDKENILKTFFNASSRSFLSLGIKEYSEIDESVFQIISANKGIQSISTRYTLPFDYYLLLCICSSDEIKNIILTYLVSLYEYSTDEEVKNFILNTLIKQVEDFSSLNNVNQRLKAVSNDVSISLFGNINNVSPEYFAPFPAVFQTSAKVQKASDQREELFINLAEVYNREGPRHYVATHLGLEDPSDLHILEEIIKSLNQVDALKKTV